MLFLVHLGTVGAAESISLLSELLDLGWRTFYAASYTVEKIKIRLEKPDAGDVCLELARALRQTRGRGSRRGLYARRNWRQ